MLPCGARVEDPFLSQHLNQGSKLTVVCMPPRRKPKAVYGDPTCPWQVQEMMFARHLRGSIFFNKWFQETWPLRVGSATPER